MHSHDVGSGGGCPGRQREGVGRALEGGKGGKGGEWMSTGAGFTFHFACRDGCVRLDVSNNNLADSEAAILARSPSLTWLNLHSNALSSMSLTMLAMSKTLVHLDVSTNRVDNAGGFACVTCACMVREEAIIGRQRGSRL